MARLASRSLRQGQPPKVRTPITSDGSRALENPVRLRNDMYRMGFTRFKNKKSKQSRKANAKTTGTRRARQNNNAQSRAMVVYRGPPREANCIRELATSIVDPFRMSSCIPDGSPGVGKFSTKATLAIGTGAAGSACMFALNPGQLNNEYYVDTSSTTVTPTVSGNWVASTNSAQITPLYQRLRPISAGLRVSYTGSTMNDQGTLVLLQVPASFALSNFNGASLYSASTSAMWYKVLPLRQGGMLTWRPGDVDDQAVFTLPDTTTAVTSQPVVPRPYLVAVIYGAQSATPAVATIEYVVNWEGQYRSQGFAPGGINTGPSASRPEIGWYERAAALYRNVAPIVSLVANGIMMPAQRSPATGLITARSGISVEEID